MLGVAGSSPVARSLDDEGPVGIYARRAFFVQKIFPLPCKESREKGSPSSERPSIAEFRRWTSFTEAHLPGKANLLPGSYHPPA